MLVNDAAAGSIACSRSTGSTFSGNASGTSLNTGDPEGWAWVDFNRDGRADYCRVLTSSSTLACTLSTGSSFASTVTSAPLDVGYPQGRAWADVDNDGRADYCRRVGDAANPRISCTLARDGVFGSTLTSTPVEWGLDQGGAWTDFDADGDRDFCRPTGTQPTNMQVFCTLWTPSGLGQTVTSGPLDWGSDRVWVDFNGDRKADYCRRVGSSPDNERVACTTSTGSEFGPVATATPMPTPTAAPVLTSAPVPTPAPAGSATPRRIVVTLAYDYTARARSTRLRRLVVRGIPRGATVTARCPKGCARKSLTKRKARSTLSLAPLIRRPLVVGTTITVTVSRPREIAAVKILRVRSRRAPQVLTRCRAPGARRVTTCRADSA